jgi:hypothetical protein
MTEMEVGRPIARPHLASSRCFIFGSRAEYAETSNLVVGDGFIRVKMASGWYFCTPALLYVDVLNPPHSDGACSIVIRGESDSGRKLVPRDDRQDAAVGISASQR